MVAVHSRERTLFRVNLHKLLLFIISFLPARYMDESGSRVSKKPKFAANFPVSREFGLEKTIGSFQISD